VIDPVFVEACRFSDCSGNGQCSAQRDGTPLCLCEVGYGGPQCDGCEAGFHRDSKQRCAPDRRCAEQTTNPCGLYGSCADQEGVIACHCDPGYEGPRCNLCANGYGRDAYGECLQLVISDGNLTDAGVTMPDKPGKCADGKVGTPTRVDFESFTTFPEFENNCISGVTVDTAGLALTSIAADGEVWACAPNTLYGLSTKHVFLEAGTLGPAQLIFSGAISQLSFDYGARSALSLEVLADGKAVATLTAARRMHDSQMFTFDPPARLIELRSLNQSTQQIGIDNIVYTLSACP